MALPVSPPPPPPDDIAVSGWAGITVRVAWTLLSMGTKVTPEVLRDAREHVLYHLPAKTPLTAAEDLASALTRSFVYRARAESNPNRWPQDATMPLSPRWKAALDRALTPLSEVVLKQHYGDQRSLEYLEQLYQIDQLTLQASRGGLREIVRQAGAADGVPIKDWPDERLDGLLVRLASYAPGPCPPTVDVAHGAYAEHVSTCPRCDRIVRLSRAGVLDVEDLLPPSFGARPKRTVRILALQVHPDAASPRGVRESVLELVRTELGGIPCHPLQNDVLLIDLADEEAVLAVLALATEVGMPPRDLLRGAVLEGPGTWSAHGLLGPLAAQTLRRVSTRTWGTIDELGELPDRLPEPPSARGWWAGVLALAAVTALVVRLAVPTAASAEDLGLQVEFTAARGGVWTAFDVDEERVVAIVQEGPEGLEAVIEPTSAAEKAELAVGDGSYRVHLPAPAVLVVALDGPAELGDLEAFENLEQAATALRAQQPDALVRIFRTTP